MLLQPEQVVCVRECCCAHEPSKLPSHVWLDAAGNWLDVELSLTIRDPGRIVVEGAVGLHNRERDKNLQVRVSRLRLPSVGLCIPRRVGRELPKLVIFCGVRSDYSMSEYVWRLCRIAYNAV